MPKSLLSFVLLLFACSSLYAQTVVKGVITSKEDGSQLPGVSIIEKGTTNGSVSDDKGQFTINVKGSNAKLVFSFIGFASQEVTVGSESFLRIALEEDIKFLQEAVVVGYGTAAKETHVGSLTAIKSAEITNRPTSNALTALVGAAPGIQTTASGGAPGSAPEVRIRGFGSISASNGALYVVDGSVFDASTATLNPEDIESMSILKDAATTAIYGSRGANGVVMITTKKGKEGKSNLTLNVSGGAISRGLPEYETVGANEYYPLMWEAYRNSLAYRASNPIPMDVANSIASGLTPSYNGASYSGVHALLGNNPFNVANDQIVGVDGKLNPNAKLLYADDLNWAKAIQRGGKSRKNVALTYDGGTAKTNHFVSLGYTKEEGYLLKSDLERFTARINVNSTPTKWLKTGLALNGNYSKSNDDAGSEGGTSIVNPFYVSRYIAPIYPVHEHDPATGAYLLDENGNKIYNSGDGRPFTPGRHVVWENQLNNRQSIRGTVGARTYATVKILPYLSATTNVTFDLQDTHDRRFDNPIIGDGAPAGRAFHYLYRTTSYTWNQLLEFEKSYGKHNVGAVVGHENYSYKYNYLTAQRSGIIVDGITELPNFASVLGATSYENNRSIESYFGRVNYDFDKKYILSATFRRDGNSRFAPAQRWANFWSVGGAYNIEKEDFFNVSWVDFLKIRSSYGLVGNDAGLGNYAYQALYTLGRNNADEPGFVQASILNNNITWETSKTFDVGLDFSLLRGRLNGTVEYFNRMTDGLIFPVPLALSNGGTTTDGGFRVNQNIGNLTNKGVELQLTGSIIDKGPVRYSTTLNLTSFKNQITKMPENQPLIQSGSKAYSVGHSIYDFYMREFVDVDPETGNSRYRTNAMTSNAKIVGNDTLTTVISEANYRYTGHSSIPDVYGSMKHDLSYKGFTLSFLLTFQVGGKVYDSNYLSLMHGGSYGTAMHIDAHNRWQKAGDITNVPRFDPGNVSNQTGASTRYLTDASYLQLANVALSYSLPKHVVQTIGAKDVRLSFTGENLGLFNARRGMNSVGSFNGTVDNIYTFNKIWTLGARINF